MVAVQIYPLFRLYAFGSNSKVIKLTLCVIARFCETHVSETVSLKANQSLAVSFFASSVKRVEHQI